MVTPPQPCNSGHLAGIVTTVQTVFQQLCIDRELQWWDSASGATCLVASQYSAAGAMVVYALKLKGRHVADVCLVNPESLQDRMLTEMPAELPAFGRRVAVRVLTLRELSQRMDAVARGKYRNDGMPYFALAVNLPAATQAAMRLAFVNFAYAAGLLHSVPTTLHFDPERRYQYALHVLDRMVEFALSSRQASDATTEEREADDGDAHAHADADADADAGRVGDRDGVGTDGAPQSGDSSLSSDTTSGSPAAGMPTLVPVQRGMDVATDTDDLPCAVPPAVEPTPCTGCAALQDALRAAQQQVAEASGAVTAATAAAAVEAKARSAAVSRHSSLEGKWNKEREGMRRELASLTSARAAAEKGRARAQAEAAEAVARSAAEVQRLRAELQQAQAANDAQTAAHARALVRHQEELAQAQEHVHALERKVLDMQHQVTTCKSATVSATGASEDAKRQLRDIQEWVLHDRRQHEDVVKLELTGLRAEVVREFAGLTGQLLEAHKALHALQASVTAEAAVCMEGMTQDRLDHSLWKPVWGLWDRELSAASHNYRELFAGAGPDAGGASPVAAATSTAEGSQRRASVCPAVELAVRATAFVVKTLHLSSQFRVKGAAVGPCGPGKEEKAKQRCSGGLSGHAAAADACSTVEQELLDETLWRNMVYTQEGEVACGDRGCPKDDRAARDLLRRMSEMGGCRPHPAAPEEAWSPEVLATCRALWHDLLVQHVLRPVAAVWSMRQGDLAQQLDTCHSLVGSLIETSRSASAKVLAVMQRARSNLCKAQLTAPFENTMAAPMTSSSPLSEVPLLAAQVCVEAVEPRLDQATPLPVPSAVTPAEPSGALLDKAGTPAAMSSSSEDTEEDHMTVVFADDVKVAHPVHVCPAVKPAGVGAGAGAGAGAGVGAASGSGVMPFEVRSLLGEDASAYERLYAMVFPKGLVTDLESVGDPDVGPCIAPSIAQFVFPVPGAATPDALFLSDLELLPVDTDSEGSASSRRVPLGNEVELGW
jgi:hypothetical protein